MNQVPPNEICKRIINAFINVCRGAIREHVVALYLRGSYPRGDWVFGLSDLDFYLIIKDTILRKNTLKSIFESRIDTFFRNIQKKHPDFFITYSYDSLKKVTKEKSKSYVMSQDSLFLFGKDVLKEFPKPTLDEIKQFGRKMTIFLCDYWMNSMDLKNAIKSRTDAIRIAQYMLLKIAQNALFAQGILSFKKSEVVEKFEEEYRFFRFSYLVREAYYIRSHWPSIQINLRRIDRFLFLTQEVPKTFCTDLQQNMKSKIM